LTAACRDRKRVEMADFTDSCERIVLGAERRLLMSDEDRRRTAYHEAGHAIVGMLTPHADPVRKVSIIPRGRALGVTMSTPDRDRLNYDENALIARTAVALGGRAAEQLIYGTHTAGAESDLEQVTAIARQMVGRWGTSEVIGPITALPSHNDSPLLPGPRSPLRRRSGWLTKRCAGSSPTRTTTCSRFSRSTATTSSRSPTASSPTSPLAKTTPTERPGSRPERSAEHPDSACSVKPGRSWARRQGHSRRRSASGRDGGSGQ
jgi:hypothetical protein